MSVVARHALTPEERTALVASGAITLPVAREVSPLADEVRKMQSRAARTRWAQAAKPVTRRPAVSQVIRRDLLRAVLARAAAVWAIAPEALLSVSRSYVVSLARAASMVYLAENRAFSREEIAAAFGMSAATVTYSARRVEEMRRYGSQLEQPAAAGVFQQQRCGGRRAMSLKPEAITQFYRRLHARGQTTASLAAALGLKTHSYVSRLIHGHGRRRDGVWWPKLKALLQPDELALIAPEPVYAFPTVAEAVAALAAPAAIQNRESRIENRPPLNPTAAAFSDWKYRHQRSA